MNNMFNRIPPFKWFVLQNFPFIEEDFDAITNYQLLCKIVEYLNTTINKTNELGNQVEVLTNWFNNLDVRDEIDNKLDDMAESGQLAEIINEQIFNELNAKIDTLEQTTIELVNKFNFDYNNKTILIGDSYGYDRNGVVGWMNRLQTKLKMSNENCIKCPAWAGGFVAKDGTTSYLQALQNANITDKENVKNIVVIGGDNDIGQSENIPNAILEFSNYVSENFPKATIFIGMFMYSTDPSRVLNCMDVILPQYSNLKNYNNCVYLNNIQFAVRRKSFVGEDGVHLNDEGQKQLTQCIYECLKTGSCTINYTHSFFNITPSHAYDSQSGYQPFFERHTELAVIGFNDWYLEYDNNLYQINFKNNDKLDFGLWDNDFYMPIEETASKIPCEIWFNISGYGYYRSHTYVEFNKNGHVYIGLPSIYGVTEPQNINRIYFKSSCHTVSSLLV